jgi:hypothetical protein
VIGLIASTVVLGSAMGAQGAPSDCPSVFPVSSIQNGMTGYGLTVSQGRTPDTFNVRYLGVLKDGIAPGRDLIVVDTSGQAISNAGGIWFGMSGSPVYINDQLVGAIAYSLSFGPSTIAGVTPAQDMENILSFPTPTPSPSASPTPSPSASPTGSSSQQYASRGRYRRGRLTPTMSRRIRTATGSSPSSSSSFHRLSLPLSVSGVNARGLRLLTTAVRKQHLALIPYAGSSAQAANGSSSGGAMAAGDNFAAALSYGDVTAAGVGTTTFVCSGNAVSFGHPFFLQGPTSLGANQADAIAIVKDPIFGPFKLANIAESVGTVDQDRLEGLRSALGAGPPTIPVRSSVSAPDYNRSRDGSSDVVTSEFVPDVALFQMAGNVASVFDQETGGSADVTFTVTGTRADGSSWSLSRTNKFSSEYDIVYAPFFELGNDLYTLLNNRFEKVAFTGVTASASVVQQQKQLQLVKALTSTDGVTFEYHRRVVVSPGDTLYVRVTLRPTDGPSDGSADQTVDLSVTIPDHFRDGLLQVGGGGSSRRFFCVGSCGRRGSSGAKSFDELLQQLQDAPHNNDLLAQLITGRAGSTVTTTQTLDRVVSGHRRIEVVRRSRHRAVAGGGAPASKPSQGP